MAAVYSPLYMLTYARRTSDFEYCGSSSSDLFKSSKAFKLSFLFMKVNALLEYITAFSFLLNGSSYKAYVYFA